MSRCLIAYTGAGASGKQTHRAQASFNHTEDYGLLLFIWFSIDLIKIYFKLF